MTVTELTSAAGIISLLDEETDELKVYALNQLNAIVNHFWAEISDSVSKIEILYEDNGFKQRELAALIASKVYYHLGEYEDSLTFALGSGVLFDNCEESEYVETIISKCIDKYIALRKAQQEPTTGASVTIDPKLEAVVEKMFKRCFDDNQLYHAVGVALESFRLDIIKESIAKTKDLTSKIALLNYVLNMAMDVVENLDFRNKILILLVQSYQGLDEPDYDSVFQCFIHLNDPGTCAEMLIGLVKRDDYHRLIAYQIAFDLEDNASQEFLQKVVSVLPAPSNPTPAGSPVKADADAMDTDEKKPLMETDSVEMVDTPEQEAFKKIRTILSGEMTIKLNLQFLHRNNNTDFLILKNTKSHLESKFSVLHSALTFSHAFMSAGTTNDEFLRQNLDWLARATNWTKFSATAALGVIHKGQIEHGKSILAPYLPQDGVSGSVYSEGGSLFALGLINANHDGGVVPYLSNALQTASNETVQAGACLGLGVAAMATDDEKHYESLKNILFSDSAVAGESAGIAMGLIMLGTGSFKAYEEMMQYAHETQHEKIIRGLSIGVALVFYGREEEADAIIEEMCNDKASTWMDPIIRYGGIFAVALAYSGTGNNKAIKRLLHVAVSDVSDDVRRAAVISIGFVLFKTPKQVPKVVQLLSESYNPHVRYGATLALGISCAGTGMKEALDLIEPMIKDTVDFVRQGALISTAMILVQHNETMSPQVAPTRKLFEDIISAKREDIMAKFGAVLAQGILDAGGRNVTLTLASRDGHNNMPAIVGMALFTQLWYWYPLTLFLSLSFTPTGLIALNKNLETPNLTFKSNVKSSLFAYPPKTQPPTEEVVEKVATAVLSTTAKAKARAKKAEKDKGGVADMETDDKKEETVEEKGKQVEEEKKPKKKEDPFSILENLSRVLPQQSKYIVFEEQSRYVPVKKGALGGIMLMNDLKPDEKEDIITFTNPGVPPPAATTAAPTTAASEPEVAPPTPFEYSED